MKKSIKIKSAIIIKPILIVLFSLFIIYIILGIFGYGTDCDTYLMLKSGRNMWLYGNYDYSRGPGNFLPEMIIGGASLIGGSLLTNLISAILGTATLYIFWQLLKNVFSDSNALLITLIIGLNPFFIIASSSSMDYVYSLFFCMAGIQLLTKRFIFLSAFLFAFAASSRLSSVMIIGIIYLYYLYIRFKESNFKEMTRLLLSGCLMVILTILFFVPSYIAAGYTFDFFSYGYPDRDFFGLLSRFLYKNIYLFGLFIVPILAFITVWKLIRSRLNFQYTKEVTTGVAIVIATEILFFKIPVEISYLLPILFVVIPLFVLVCQPRQITMFIIIFLTFSYSFLVNLDVLDIKREEYQGELVSADVGLFVRHGVVIDDLQHRDESKILYGKQIDK